MVACDQSVDHLNIRQLALYTGLQLEELGEKMEAILGDRAELVVQLKKASADFKRGEHDVHIALADRVELLDADLDLTWVSLGSANSTGACVNTAWNAIDDSNMAKVDPTTGKALRDANGKIQKPAGWAPPNLAPAFR